MLESLKKRSLIFKETKQMKEGQILNSERHKVQEGNCHHSTVFGLAVNNIYIVIILKIRNMDLTKT